MSQVAYKFGFTKKPVDDAADYYLAYDFLAKATGQKYPPPDPALRWVEPRHRDVFQAGRCIPQRSPGCQANPAAHIVPLQRIVWMLLGAVFCSAALIGGEARGYDGPVGVTLVSPWIERRGPWRSVVLERLSVRTEVAPDPTWRRDSPENRGRAFPDGFEATLATTVLRMALRNVGGAEARVSLVIPFRASAAAGTGFVHPETIDVVGGVGGPASPRAFDTYGTQGLFALRGLPIALRVPARGMIDPVVTVRHRLAINPSWFSFDVRGASSPRKKPSTEVEALLGDRTPVDLSLVVTDPMLASQGCRVRICTLPPATCDVHTARLGDLTREWFAARTSSGPLVSIHVNRTDAR